MTFSSRVAASGLLASRGRRPRENCTQHWRCQCSVARQPVDACKLRRLGNLRRICERRRIAVPKFYFEDFSPGWTAEYGPRRVTREEMIGFAAQFDPQPMHLDEVAAAKTMLGGLGASGWHTCCVMMKMIADGVLLDSASMGAPGIDEVKWLKPVRPGDSLRSEERR